jgi:alpha-beta hydrolase superfamily lysophospholipase
MTATDTFLTTADGLRLRLRVWSPAARPHGVLILTHGHGEHLGRYDHTAQALCAAGYAVYTYDLRGHGRSQGKQGHSPSFLTYLDDLQQAHELARRELPGRRLWLMGHSMGSLITLMYAIWRQPDVAGLVISAPPLRVKYAPPAWKVLMARSLSRVLPSLTLATGLDVSMPMTHDNDLLAAMPDPDLAHAMMSLRVGADIFTYSALTLARAPELRLPLLLLQGGADGAVDLEATRQFYEQASSADKTFKLYPGFYHEVLNETGRAQVVADILAWLDARTAEK